MRSWSRTLAAVGSPLLLALPLLAAPAHGASRAPVAKEPAQVASVSLAVAKAKCAGVAGCTYGTQAGAVFQGLAWGMTHKQVVELYNKPGGLIDQEYNPALARLQPGRIMSAKEAERDDKKRAFAASWVEFKSTPTGYDASPIRAEYSYRNHEAVMAVEHEGLRRYFFFIGAVPGERLWKVYDEVRLGDGAVLGRTFQEAAGQVAAHLGAGAVSVPQDAAKGIIAPTVAWQDEKSRLRLVDRTGEGIVAVVLEDKQVLGALPQLRVNRLDDPFALDPSVRAITQAPISDPSAEKQKPAPVDEQRAKKKR